MTCTCAICGYDVISGDDLEQVYRPGASGLCPECCMEVTDMGVAPDDAIAMFGGAV